MTGVCAQLGDGDAAGRLSERLAPWAGHHLAASHLYLGAADHHLGILNAVAGRGRTASPISRPPPWTPWPPPPPTASAWSCQDGGAPPSAPVPEG